MSILVLDVGTSALKAALFAPSGAILANAEAGYPAMAAAHRQSVEGWWQAARTAVARLGPVSVEAVALAGTMENLIAVDGDGRAVCDAILYSDPCGAAAHAGALPRLADAGAILGNAPEPLMTAFKLAWLRDAEPEAFAAARWFLPGAKDAIVLRLTGRAVTDPVTATTTGLMDLRTRRWGQPLLSALDISAASLPEILPAGATVGHVGKAALAALGLDASAPVPVINGCGDGGATTLGSFCGAEGDISLYLGTSGWVARVVAAGDLSPNPAVYRLAHPTEGLLIEITPILSAGASGNWIRAILDLPEDERDAALARADASPSDLVFLPYLAGERFPFFDADVRGAFIGLDASHERHDLYYAVLEGVAFAIRANLETLDPDGTGDIRLAGGGATSVVWPQMIADILGRPVSVPPDPANATAMGAFLIAAETLGLYAVGVSVGRIVMPREQRSGRVARLGRAFAKSTDIAKRIGK